MPVLFRCDACRGKLSISRRKIGIQIECPRCAQPITVPGIERVSREVTELLTAEQSHLRPNRDGDGNIPPLPLPPPLRDDELPLVDSDENEVMAEPPAELRPHIPAPILPNLPVPEKIPAPGQISRKPFPTIPQAKKTQAAMSRGKAETKPQDVSLSKRLEDMPLFERGDIERYLEPTGQRKPKSRSANEPLSLPDAMPNATRQVGPMRVVDPDAVVLSRAKATLYTILVAALMAIAFAIGHFTAGK